MVRKLIWAAVLATCAPAIASAAESAKPLSYRDAAYCSALFQIAMDVEAMQGDPDSNYARTAKPYRDLALKSAVAIGAANGVSRETVDADSKSALSEARQDLIDGNFEGTKPGTYALDVYLRVCVDLVDAYAKANK